MDKYDLLEAMSGIRDQYIEEAGRMPEADPAGEETEEQVFKKASQRPSRAKRSLFRLQRWAAPAAAVLCLSLLLPNLSPGAASAFGGIPVLGRYFRMVTVRSYEHADERSDAYVEEPAIVSAKGGGESSEEVDSEIKSSKEQSLQKESAAEPGPAEQSSEETGPAEQSSEETGLAEQSSEETGPADETSIKDGDAGSRVSRTSGVSVLAGTVEELSPESAKEYELDEPSEDDETAAGASSEEAEDASIQAVLTAAQVTEEVRDKARAAIADFEKGISGEHGYMTLRFTHETVTDSADWLCVAVNTFTASADGWEQTDHFVINKKTGERTTLESWFGSDIDYITPISENIISQMKDRMASDPDVQYWIDSEEDPDSDFSLIRPDQDFYFNDRGDLVVCFDEMEVAPMYMGTVEFTIPRDITDALRKEGQNQ